MESLPYISNQGASKSQIAWAHGKKQGGIVY
jgi:hypothetical protein